MIDALCAQGPALLFFDLNGKLILSRPRIAKIPEEAAAKAAVMKKQDSLSKVKIFYFNFKPTSNISNQR